MTFLLFKEYIVLTFPFLPFLISVFIPTISVESERRLGHDFEEATGLRFVSISGTTWGSLS